jgi:hypothetical protein
MPAATRPQSDNGRQGGTSSSGTHVKKANQNQKRAARRKKASKAKEAAAANSIGADGNVATMNNADTIKTKSNDDHIVGTIHTPETTSNTSELQQCVESKESDDKKKKNDESNATHVGEEQVEQVTCETACAALIAKMLRDQGEQKEKTGCDMWGEAIMNRDLNNIFKVMGKDCVFTREQVRAVFIHDGCNLDLAIASLINLNDKINRSYKQEVPNTESYKQVTPSR